MDIQKHNDYLKLLPLESLYALLEQIEKLGAKNSDEYQAVLDEIGKR